MVKQLKRTKYAIKLKFFGSLQTSQHLIVFQTQVIWLHTNILTPNLCFETQLSPQPPKFDLVTTLPLS